MPSPHNVQAVIIAIFLWLGWLRLQARFDIVRKHSTWILLALALFSLAAHANYLRYQRELDRRDSWDFYVYYMGPKYFPELGYHGLYDAHTIADYEDDRRAYRPMVWVRSLDDYRLVQKQSIVERKDEIVAWFAPDRWQAFKADIGVFRPKDVFERRESSWSRDHGYNGAPLTTAINGTLLRQPLLSTERFVQLMSWSDLLLVIAAGAIIAQLLGAQWGLLFAVAFGANPLNDYITVGGSYLRYLHLVSLALGIVALRKGRGVTAGILFAVATHLRIFPVLFAAALLLSDLLRRERRRLLLERRRFYLSFAAAGLLLLAGTSLLRGPGEQNVWIDFAQNTLQHSKAYSVNMLGLKYLFMYADETNLEAMSSSPKPIDWRAEVTARFARNVVGYGFAAAALVALSILYLRRIRDSEEALFVGLVWVFVLLQVAVYDYVLMSLVPLIFARDQRMWWVLGLTWLAICLVIQLPASKAAYDWGFNAISVVLAAYLAGTLALRAFVWREPDLPDLKRCVS
ncbi:MAG: DUF2029 domain-containing protein [Deltaproteobacteria bacterium]|jgi:hypothetical protein|nr:DUF2029 domain-containing protein [Deltaproteobacteria bacterium]